MEFEVASVRRRRTARHLRQTSSHARAPATWLYERQVHHAPDRYRRSKKVWKRPWFRGTGIRIRLAPDAKNLAIHAEPAFLKGQVEIQDEGSQLAALLADAKPGQQVVDLCAGAGGKTLALAAAMENRGQIYATDIDKRRLAPIHERIARAGARNIQVRTLPTARGTSSAGPTTTRRGPAQKT